MKLMEQAEDKFRMRQKEEYDPFLDCKFTTTMIDEHTGRAWHYNREHKSETVGTYLQRVFLCTFKWNWEKEEKEETREKNETEEE